MRKTVLFKRTALPAKETRENVLGSDGPPIRITLSVAGYIIDIAVQERRSDDR